MLVNPAALTAPFSNGTRSGVRPVQLSRCSLLNVGKIALMALLYRDRSLFYLIRIYPLKNDFLAKRVIPLRIPNLIFSIKSPGK